MTSTTVLAASLGLAAALAQNLPQIADPDGNGLWSLAELQAAYPDLTPEVFTGIDENGDAGVDPVELAVALAHGILPAQPG